MQPRELKALYEEACKAQRQDPEPAEFKMWKVVLCSYDFRDVSGALTAWWAGEHGMYLPKPAELKPEADRLARIRRREQIVDFCKECGLGRRCVVGVDGKLTIVRCECAECIRARAAIARVPDSGAERRTVGAQNFKVGLSSGGE
jgi:hypothetical protein